MKLMCGVLYSAVPSFLPPYSQGLRRALTVDGAADHNAGSPDAEDEVEQHAGQQCEAEGVDRTGGGGSEPEEDRVEHLGPEAVGGAETRPSGSAATMTMVTLPSMMGVRPILKPLLTAPSRVLFFAKLLTWIRSAVMTLASTPIPMPRMIPAMPGSVRVEAGEHRKVAGHRQPW